MFEVLSVVFCLFVLQKKVILFSPLNWCHLVHSVHTRFVNGGARINFSLLLVGSWAEVLDGLSGARAVSWWALAGPHCVPEDLTREGTHFS